MSDDPLAGLEDWLGAVLQGLSPAQRKRAGMKIGQALRKSNLQRIAKNVEPEGAAMEKRKARLDQTGRTRRKAGGKMFRKLRLVRNFRITATPDSVEIAPIGGAAKVAREHHYGLRGFVGRGPDGAKVFTRYGSLLFELIDKPINGAIRLLLQAATAIALRRWEPRLRLTRVTLSGEPSAGRLTIRIEGVRTDLPPSNALTTLTIPIDTRAPRTAT